MSDFEAGTTARTDITGDYTIDTAHSRLGFVARHAMVTKVRGQFKDFSGTAHVDSADPAASRVSITIAAASLDSGSADRDGHLLSADFFGVEASPEIVFVSTEVSREGTDWTVVGNLTMKGVSRQVALDFEEVGTAKDPFGNIRLGFEGSTTINRSDWGLNFNAALETGGVLVSEKIKLELDISAIADS